MQTISDEIGVDIVVVSAFANGEYPFLIKSTKDECSTQTD